MLFEWHTSREAKCLEKLIPIHFNGTIQCDEYAFHGSQQRWAALPEPNPERLRERESGRLHYL